MYMTHVKPVRDLRNRYPELSEILKKLDHVIITNHGKSEAVLIPYEEFEIYQEFAHRRYIAKKLAEAEENIKSNPDDFMSAEDFMKEWDSWDAEVIV